MDRAERTVLIITGMHRSGTSIFTRALMEWGIDIFGELMKANRGNPRGYYENIDIVRLHNKILKKNGGWYFDNNLDEKLGFDNRDVEQAYEIIAPALNDILLVKAFKDPRASLFLNLWDRVLEGYKLYYIFLLRHPLRVIDSLFRRDTDPIFNREPVIALSTWLVYNQRILNYVKSSRNKFMIVSIDNFVKEPMLFANGLSKMIGFKLKESTLDGVLHKRELNQGRIGLMAWKVALLHPDLWFRCIRVYGELLSASKVTRST